MLGLRGRHQAADEGKGQIEVFGPSRRTGEEHEGRGRAGAREAGGEDEGGGEEEEGEEWLQLLLGERRSGNMSSFDEGARSSVAWVLIFLGAGIIAGYVLKTLRCVHGWRCGFDGGISHSLPRCRWSFASIFLQDTRSEIPPLSSPISCHLDLWLLFLFYADVGSCSVF